MLSAAERRADELKSSDQDGLINELKSQQDEQQRRTAQLQAQLEDETRKLSADKVKHSGKFSWQQGLK